MSSANRDFFGLWLVLGLGTGLIWFLLNGDVWQFVPIGLALYVLRLLLTNLKL